MSLVERVGLDEFLPFVMAACPDLPEAMATAYIRQACIDFCTRSGILRRKTWIDQQRDVRAYPVWPDAGETIVRINEVHVDGRCYRGARNRCCFDHFGIRFTVDDGMLRLSSPPGRDKPQAIEVRFVAAPERNACEVDALLYEDWADAIEDGTLAKLYLLPAYSFASPTLAKARRGSYDDHVRRARVRALKSDTGDSTVAIAPPFV
ncbi:hypothetical protein [Dyella sp.]|uniref:hypothetical protein n=1 Tax=Dyella sp. TaxID=1869338 RepID=UPI002FDB33BF